MPAFQGAVQPIGRRASANLPFHLNGESAFAMISCTGVFLGGSVACSSAVMLQSPTETEEHTRQTVEDKDADTNRWTKNDVWGHKDYIRVQGR
jgi:hypothetical protein